MKPLDLVNGLDIASPCKASWNAMKGDDRARLCALCDKHVYNIATMTVAEVTDLVKETEGEFCGRLYRRRDGTVLTADCPIGAKAFSSGRLHRVLTYGVLAIGFVSTGAFLKAAQDRNLEEPPTGSGATFADWKDWALRAVGIRVASVSKTPGVMGGIRRLPPGSLDSADNY
jgi:hypothetical protein